MKRQPLLLASIGGAAVLATIGATLGVAAADDRSPRTVPVSAGTPSTAAGPDGTRTSGAPDDGATSGAPDDSATTDTTSGPGAGVDQRRAGEIALAEVGGGRIVEIEAEWEHGRSVWDVEIRLDGVEHEVDVDRETGAVVRYERDDDDDDHGRDDDSRVDDRDDDSDDRDDDGRDDD